MDFSFHKASLTPLFFPLITVNTCPELPSSRGNWRMIPPRNATTKKVSFSTVSKHSRFIPSRRRPLRSCFFHILKQCNFPHTKSHVDAFGVQNSKRNLHFVFPTRVRFYLVFPHISRSPQTGPGNGGKIDVFNGFRRPPSSKNWLLEAPFYPLFFFASSARWLKDFQKFKNSIER